MLVILGGIIAGLIHVLSGPDHLAAIAPLAMKKRSGAWRTGLRWGAGHASGVAVVGLLSLLLRGVLPVGLISNWSDRLVGVLLIGIGLWTLRKALQVHTHEHVHQDGQTCHDEAHVHIHIHARGKPKAQAKPGSHLHTHAAFGIGTLHGLAGSSHFLAIIPSLALPSNALAISYLAAYGVGTVLAMIAFSSAIGSLTTRFAGAAHVYRGFMFACSAVAILVGGFWLLGFSF
jgi:cytochrome c biogenesis protein CcdA